MPYKVIKDGATIPEQLGVRTGKSRITGESATIRDLRSHVYGIDHVIEDEKIAPHVIEAYEDGDPHVTSLIEKIEEEAPKKTASKKKATSSKKSE